VILPPLVFPTQGKNSISHPSFSHRLYVRGSRHPGHQRPTATPDGFSTRQVHERDQEPQDRDHSLRYDEEKVQSLQRHSKARPGVRLLKLSSAVVEDDAE
jgi:hypothetical protein